MNFQTKTQNRRPSRATGSPLFILGSGDEGNSSVMKTEVEERSIFIHPTRKDEAGQLRWHQSESEREGDDRPHLTETSTTGQ